MIPRYTRPQMAAIWDPQTRYRIWFEIEAHAADAMAELGVIPKAAAQEIWAKGKDAKFDVARIEEIERTTKHDVIAFLTFLEERIGPAARWLHFGMTSSDVLDTSLGMMPSSAMASAACASISNQMRKRVCGSQIAAISGRV